MSTTEERPMSGYNDWPEDVLRYIVDLVSSNGALLSLACTSRLLSSLALDKIWHTIPDLVVLARCMDRPYWEEPEVITEDWFGYGRDKRRFSTSEIMLSTHERSEDWPGERFRQYAARINSVDINHGRRIVHPSAPRTKWRIPYLTTTVHLDVLIAWASHSQSGQSSLFPNLKHLTVRTLVDRMETSMRANCFLLPSVVSIHSTYHAHLSESEAQERVLAIVHEAFARCPLIHTITFTDIDMDPHSFSNLKNCAHKSLKELRVRGSYDGFVLSQDMAEHWATLPNLEVAPILGHLVRKKYTFSPFPALRELCVNVDTARQLQDTLETVTSTSIHSMTIDMLDEIGTPEEITPVLHLIAARPTAPALRALNIRFNWPQSQRPKYDGPPAQLDDIEPILKLAGLHTLDIQMKYGSTFAMDDADFHSMLHAWPRLEHLHIHPLPSPPRFRLDDFVRMLPKYPSLVSTHLLVDCVLDAALPTTPGCRYADLYGVSFIIMRGEAEETVDRTPLAHYLMTTFPRCRGSEYVDGDSHYCRVDGDEETTFLVGKAAVAYRNTGNMWSLDQFEALARSKVMYRFAYRRPSVTEDLKSPSGLHDLPAEDAQSEVTETFGLDVMFG